MAREVGNSKRRRVGAKHWAMLLVVKRVANMLDTYIGADIDGHFLNFINQLIDFVLCIINTVCKLILIWTVETIDVTD